MRTLKLIFILTITMLMLSSCITYTVKDGLENIAEIQKDNPKETRLQHIERIKAEEKAEQERIEAEKKAEAQRKYEEEQALKQNLANINSAIEKKAEVNPYPTSLEQLQLPHIYRPVNTKEVLNDKFTKINTLLLPLGQEDRSLENLTLIAQNISTIPLQFIYVTGSISNQIEFARILNKDAVTLVGGTIIFTPEVVNVDADSISFRLTEGKEISTSIINTTAEGYEETYALVDSEYNEMQKKDSKSFNLGILSKLSKDRFEENKQIINSSLEDFGETAVFAISQSEPSTLDWSIFTPYSYRTDFEWPLSEYIQELGYRDTFEETRYSVEESAGITQEFGENIKERLDFFYSKGLMEVSSTTLTISGLTDTSSPTFALLATYIMP